MTAENQSFLVFQVERETTEGSKDYSARQCDVHYRDIKGGDKPHFTRGYNLDFRNLGSRIAIVTKYNDGMLNQLNVDAVMVIDGGPPLNGPFIFEQSTNINDGFSFVGRSDVDAERNGPHTSAESIRLLRGQGFEGIVKAGFVPREEIQISIGKTLDNREVRLNIKDMRPRPAIEIPQEPISRA